MEYRIVANRTKVYRSTQGKRIQLGSFPISATAIEDVPGDLIGKLTPTELRNFEAWLRGSKHRNARESAFTAFNAVLAVLKHADHLQEVDRREMCRAAWMIIEQLGGEIDQSSLKNASA